MCKMSANRDYDNGSMVVLRSFKDMVLDSEFKDVIGDDGRLRLMDKTGMLMLWNKDREDWMEKNGRIVRVVSSNLIVVETDGKEVVRDWHYEVKSVRNGEQDIISGMVIAKEVPEKVKTELRLWDLYRHQKDTIEDCFKIRCKKACGDCAYFVEMGERRMDVTIGSGNWCSWKEEQEKWYNEHKEVEKDSVRDEEEEERNEGDNEAQEEDVSERDSGHSDSIECDDSVGDSSDESVETVLGRIRKEEEREQCIAEVRELVDRLNKSLDKLDTLYDNI